MRRTRPYQFVAPFITAYFENPAIYDALTPSLKRSSWKSGSLRRFFVPLPRSEEKYRFHVPDPLWQTGLRLNLPERFRSDGGAVVVCGGGGEALRPYVKEHPALSKNASGWFSLRSVGYTISISPDSVVRIVRRSLERPDIRTVFITREILYEGPGFGLPPELSRYRPAIIAAATKAEHPEYRRLYYYVPYPEVPEN